MIGIARKLVVEGKMGLILESLLKKTNKKGQMTDYFFKILIAILILVVMVLVILVLTGKGQEAISFIRGILRL